MKKEYDAITLFSGGLDSLLAAKMLEAQGLKILCAHFISPFFGNEAKIPHWAKIWKLEIKAFDIGMDFCHMLARGPEHGFGSVINPCVDCKIMILSRAREAMAEYGAKFLATGEVLGQRPMSQRRDSLDLIQNKAGVKGLLLRPLCALHLAPTPMEEKGLVRRELLGDIQGRGRNGQLEMAKKFGLGELPSPAGGCVLTEKENGRRYWQIIKRLRQRECGDDEILRDFRLGRIGRQYWLQDGDRPIWLCIGRNSADNQALLALAREGDLTIKLCDYSGPVGLAVDGESWSGELLLKAGSLLASYAREALAAGKARLSIFGKTGRRIINVDVNKENKEGQFTWLPDWERVREEIRADQKKRGI